MEFITPILISLNTIPKVRIRKENIRRELLNLFKTEINCCQRIGS